MSTIMNKYFTLIILSFVGLFSLACIWDRDTIEMERQRFPNTLEIISGKFLRHSPEFYQWRVEDREAKLKINPKQWNYYDDLAVAYEKLGNHAKAIELMLQKEKLHPGQYETYANLGTFYIHNKEYQKGLQYIDKAIAINPNAHFGREVYQKHLVEYVLSKMQNGKVGLPLSKSGAKKYTSFYRFLQEKNVIKNSPKAAIKGVLGMMKFGNFRSPVLLEALGDLLRMHDKQVDENANILAYIAYQKAAKEVKNPDAKTGYSSIDNLIFYDIEKYSDKPTQKKARKILKKAIQEGELFYQQIKNDEIRWISEGKNPEEEFKKKYYNNPGKQTPKKTITTTKEETKPESTVAKVKTKNTSKTTPSTQPNKKVNQTPNRKEKTLPLLPMILAFVGTLIVVGIVIKLREGMKT